MNSVELMDFQYTIVRTARRKTASIHVSEDNRVTIAIPQFVSDERAAEIIRLRSPWIMKRMELNRELQGMRRPRRYNDGEELLYLGESCVLRLEDGLTPGVELRPGVLRVRIPSRVATAAKGRFIERLLVDWYRARAMEEFTVRVGRYAAGLNVQPRVIRVKHLKSRWGSCSSRGSLSFAWQVVMAPPDIIDYLVVHELCHLVYLDHSNRFWNLVESVLPDYRNRRTWLKTNGHLLQ